MFILKSKFQTLQQAQIGRRVGEYNIQNISFLSGDGPELLGGGGADDGTVLDYLLVGLVIHGNVGNIGFGRYLLEDVVIVLPGHEFIDKLVGPLYDLIDFFNLLFLDLFVTGIQDLLVLAVLLHRTTKCVRQGVCIGLLDWGVVEGQSQRFLRVCAREDVCVLDGKDGCLLLVQFLPDGIVKRVQLQISQKFLLILEVVEQLRKSFLILFEQHANCKDEASTVSVYHILYDAMQLFLQKEFAIFLERGRLDENLSQCNPIIFLFNVGSALVKVVYIFLGGDKPIPESDLVLMSDDDAGGGECAVDEVVLVEGSKTLDDGEEGIEDLLLMEVHQVVPALSILDLGLQRGLLLQVQQSVVVADGSEERGMREGAVGGGGGGAFEVLIGLFGGLVQEEDVVRLEFDDHELLP